MAIALAMSGKLTGGLTAVPLIVGTAFFLNRPDRLRRMALLALAGVMSAVTFVLVNPFWWAYPLHPCSANRLCGPYRGQSMGNAVADPPTSPRQAAFWGSCSAFCRWPLSAC